MLHIHSRLAVTLALCSTAVLLPASMPLAPAPSAPELQEILGSWTIDISYSGYELPTGAKFKEKESSVLQITDQGGNVVRLFDTVAQQEIFGRYVNGFLLLGNSSATPTEGEPVPDMARSFVIQISGKAPRLKGKGSGTEFEIEDDYAATAKVKMTKLPPQ